MGHSKELLDRISDDLRGQYPEREYRYEFEKPLRLSDRRNQPDIQVFDERNRLVSVVEIGYTRPEKLKLYHDENIPDIRWYSKAGDLVSVPRFNGPTTPIVREVKHRIHEADVFRRIPMAFNAVECQKVADRVYELKANSKTLSLWGKMRAIVGVCNSDPVFLNHDDGHLRGHLAHWTLDNCDWCRDQVVYESETQDTQGFFYSNGVYSFLVNECDVCGHTTIEHDPRSLSARIALEKYDPLDSWAAFRKHHAKIGGEETPVAELPVHLKEQFGLDFDFDDLREDDHWLFRHATETEN
ncbi:MAG: hypothetical protein WB660_00415 [Candidatus Sulfotelmatobacter sp.]